LEEILSVYFFKANLKKEAEGLLESIEGRQFMAHANSILEGASGESGNGQLS